jgi:hypothetical protein
MDTKTITLKDGRLCIVDAEDFANLSRWTWHLWPTGSVVRYTAQPSGKGGWTTLTRTMYQEVLGLGRGKRVVYRDGNKLNLTKSNLVVVTPEVVHRNLCLAKGKQKWTRWGSEPTSRFKGVYWNSQRSNWSAAVRTNGKRFYLGSFDNEEEAARAYNHGAVQLFGKGNVVLNADVGI